MSKCKYTIVDNNDKVLYSTDSLLQAEQIMFWYECFKEVLEKRGTPLKYTLHLCEDLTLESH